MKVVLLSTYDSDGGAARATYRIFKSIVKANVDSSLLVSIKRTDDFRVTRIGGKLQNLLAVIKPFFELLPLVFYRNRKLHFWSVGWIPNKALLRRVKSLKPDILQLHWITGGFVPNTFLSNISIPVIWRLSDSWAFTGGCHVPFDCTRYITGCGNCPQLNSGRLNDISRKTVRSKFENWKNCNLTIVAPSKWMADCARKSYLFKDRDIRVIPPGIDMDVFRPLNKIIVRNILGLPLNKKLIMFGAINGTSDKNKGFALLQEALISLKKGNAENNIEIVVLGATEPEEVPDMGFKCNYAGILNDEITLSMFYSSADVFVLPSLMDNSPNTVIEALACGVPAVAFGSGGAVDMISHKVNGYLARPHQIEDLTEGIKWVIEAAGTSEYEIFSKNARETALEKFDIDKIGCAYKSLYEEILLKKSLA